MTKFMEVIIEPNIAPLTHDIKVVGWGIIEPEKSIKGHRNRIEFDISVYANLSDGSSREYRWKGNLDRYHNELPDREIKHYNLGKDISVVSQWVRPRLLKHGLYRGRKTKDG